MKETTRQRVTAVLSRFSAVVACSALAALAVTAAPRSALAQTGTPHARPAVVAAPGAVSPAVRHAEHLFHLAHLAHLAHLRYISSLTPSSDATRDGAGRSGAPVLP